MIKISSKSKRRVQRLFKPPTRKTGIDFCAPIRLTVRRLLHQKRYAKLLHSGPTMILTDDGHLCSLDNLAQLGFDICG
jgi:hypothetical protein